VINGPAAFVSGPGEVSGELSVIQGEEVGDDGDPPHPIIAARTTNNAAERIR
jgi:hypothetical protein